MRYLVSISFMIVCVHTMMAQTTRPEISSMRNMDWPMITLKGQFRADLEFGLGIGNKYFDDSSDPTTLDDMGMTSTRTIYNLTLRYGILDFLELSARASYSSLIERHEPLLLFSALGSQRISYLYESKGLDDPVVMLRFKYPFDQRSFDIVGEAGAGIPVGNYGSLEPLHTYTYYQASGEEEINYHELYDPGNGTLSLYLGGMAKYRLKDLAFELRYRHLIPQGETTEVYYSENFNGNGFDYNQYSYDKFFPAFLELRFDTEYQVSDFFSSRIGIRFQDRDHGWEESTGERLAMPTCRSMWLNLGVDLIASKGIWYRQEVGVPLIGQNGITPFTITSRFTFNSFSK